MLPIPLPEDEPLLKLLKIKLDSLLARQRESIDPDEKITLVRQYWATLRLLMELDRAHFLTTDQLDDASLPDERLADAFIDYTRNQDETRETMPTHDLKTLAHYWRNTAYDILSPALLVKGWVELLEAVSENKLTERQKGVLLRLRYCSDAIMARLHDVMWSAEVEILSASGDEESKVSDEFSDG